MKRLSAAVSPRPFAMAAAAPAVISMPARLDVAALAPASAFDRWNAGVQAASELSETTITMFEVIGEDWWTGGGVTVKRVDAALRRIGDRPVDVLINSPGGDMFEGIAIYNRLRQHTAGVTVKVLGLAASAASIIAMAGDTRLIGAGAFLMIHDCWVIALGNQHDLREVADQLAPFDDAMAGVYATRTGQDEAQIRDWMDAETWMAGASAVERGFATGLLDADAATEDLEKTEQARASNALRQAEIAMCKSMSRTAARDLLAKIKGTPGAAPASTQEAAPTPGAGGEWEAGVASLLKTLKS